MAPVTELVFASLKPGTSAESLYPLFATLKSQPGNLAVRASPPSEDASSVRLLIDWDAISSHQAFRATDAYKAYLSSLGPHIAGPATVLHAELDPFPPAVLDRSPSTEVLLVYFAADATPEEEKRTLEAGRTLARKITAPGITGTTGLSAVGWSVERDVAFKGEKTRALVILVGWESDEAHANARDTVPAFKEAITEFHRVLPGIKGSLIEHVSAKVL